MRLLFAYDHRFVRDRNGQVHTSGPMHSGVWTRYLERFDRLEVLARFDPAQSADSLASAERPGVEFTEGPHLSKARSLIRPPAAATRTIAEAVERADVVVGRVPSELGRAALAEARRQGKPTLVEVVGCAWDVYWNHGSRLARLYAPLAFRRMRAAVANADFALYVTEKWLQQRYPTRQPSVNASNVELVPFDGEAQENRRIRMINVGAGAMPVLGTIASLKVRYKGVDTMIAALADLKRKGLVLEYRVLGGGDPGYYRAAADRAGVGDQVFFDGTREPGEGVARWLDTIDLYCQPSFQEGLPRATIEAMSRGLACVGSTSGGLPELLPTDRLHSPGDAGRLSEILERLIRTPGAIETAARRDHAHAFAYTPEDLARRRDGIFARLRAAALSNEQDLTRRA